MAEFLSEIKAAVYEGPGSRDPLAFKFYEPERQIAGRSMADHLRFSVAYWHSFRGGGLDPFGPAPTIQREWDDGTDSLDNALRRLRVCFEFLAKLGVRFYCFHDRDIAPEGKTLAETNRNLDRVVKLARQLQADTGIGLLWGTANLFSHPRYMCGAATNPDAHVFAYAAAQVKKALEVTAELGGRNYVFWGGREGYQTLLNTQMRRERDHLARFLTMAADYKQQIGFTGQLLIEPKPKEPTTHQYDFDVAAVLGFLREYGLQDRFKLNIEANHATLAGHTFVHELQSAADAGALGSLDANTGDPLLGWDTDQFNLDAREATLALLVVLDQDGIAPGGLNFDAKVRRESIGVEDLLVAHISSMDAFARGLEVATRIVADGAWDRWRTERYVSYDSGVGRQIEDGCANLELLAQWALGAGEPAPRSGQQEQYESLLASYLSG